jgi:hypothetical protein
VVGEITEVVHEWKASGRTEGSRDAVLRALSKVPGVYVPSLYDVEYDGQRLMARHRSLSKHQRLRWPSVSVSS